MHSGTTDGREEAGSAEFPVPPAPPSDDELVGATGDQTPNPEALIKGNRVAVAEDMD